MIIKNNNKAVDVLKNHHVCWEVRKSSIRGYAKTVISYGSWSAHKDPQTIPSISWEGGTTISSKCWIERIKLTRIGFDTYTVTEKKYLIPSFNIDSDCTVNHTGNNADGFTVTFGRYTNTTSDRTFTGSIQQESCTITVTVTQTKRDIVTVTWSLQGGNISGSTSNKTETVGYGDTVSFGKYAPSKTGYTFAGWSTSSDASSGNMSGNSNPITTNTTFYATWKSATKPKLEIGSILYSTADEKLTLDALTNGANNTPIAICVIPEVMENFKNGDESDGGVHTARFVSINYMDYNSPSTGNKDPQSMYFGNNGVTIGNTKGGTDETSYVGGKWNTQRCVSKATNQDKTSDKVDNNSGEGYCAPACCCDRYSTPGTKPGDWYLPMPGELYQIYANKTAINEKRTTLVGSGFSESSFYWSSREYSSTCEYSVYLDNGSIYSYGFNDYDSYVLGFLAVEVPSFNIPSFNIPSFKPLVNMEPVKLDTSSTKKKPAVADILYSTNDNKLTLDALTNGVNNTAIAICVIPEVMENFKNGDESDGGVHTARFVSLNYMNYDSPSTGNKDTQAMYFGNYSTTIGNVKGGTDKTSYIGGKWNTQLCLSKATNLDLNICDGVTNNSGTDYSPAACCCVAYSTPGTKSGDWYLPMPGELYQLYENKTAINEKRTAIKGSGFSENGNYWSSREYSSYYEYRVYLGNGNVDINSKDYYNYVLGFLALEV